ncbi:MAG: TIGR02281 family clan AA aspartic protease [Erythrobacter sp.]|nr:TIGR02281 family clan AA aspartic protease [Erythrobacter sp.]
MDTKLALSCVLIVGGAVGLALPASRADEHFSHPDSDAVDQTITLGAVQETRGSGWGEDLVLQRERDGHFYADVSVDGTTSRMLVDTGASVVALTGEDALAMGLSWDDADVAPVAQGASGAVYGVRTVLPRVRLGDFEAQDVNAIIVPQGLGVSLLGQSFLETLGNVSMAGDAMVLGNTPQ